MVSTVWAKMSLLTSKPSIRLHIQTNCVLQSLHVARGPLIHVMAREYWYSTQWVHDFGIVSAKRNRAKHIKSTDFNYNNVDKYGLRESITLHVYRGFLASILSNWRLSLMDITF